MAGQYLEANISAHPFGQDCLNALLTEDTAVFNWLAKILLTSTAIAPVLMSYAWVAYRAGEPLQAAVFVAVVVLLVAICLGMLRYATTQLERFAFVTTSVETADRENMGFLVLYLLPLFAAQYGALNWDVWVPAIAIFAVVVGTGYGYHFNPLLGLLRWHFYKVGTPEGITYVLITRKQLRHVNVPLNVVQLTEYVVADVGER